MGSYKELIVWQKSIDFVEVLYKLKKKFPDDEKFNLVSQIRRCAVSIPSNIAEGHGRKTEGELGHFLKIAFGSSSELETQILISYRLGLITEAEYDSVCLSLTEIRKMINAFITKLTTND